MSTRSNVCVKNSNGTYECVYCHWGGAPEENGRKLFDYYRTEENVRELLKWGYVSVLHETPEKCERNHSEPAEKCENEEAFRARYEDSWIEYVYVFDATQGRWTYYEVVGVWIFEGEWSKKRRLVGPFDLEEKLKEVE